MTQFRMLDTSNSEFERSGESERNSRYVSNRNRQDSPWVAYRYYGNPSRWIAMLIWISVCWTMLCGYVNLVLIPRNGNLPVDLNHGVIGRDEMHLVSVLLPDERISYWNPEGRQRVKAIDALMGRQRLRKLSSTTTTTTTTETQTRIDAISETFEGQTKQLNDTAADGQTGIDTTLVASNTIVFIVILLCAALRICIHIGLLGRAAGPGSSSRRFLEMDPNGLLTFRGSIARAHFQRQRRQQLSNLIDRLNAQRVTNGERPMSIDSLRLVLSNRDFNSNDYESLWTFQDDNGPSTLSNLSYVGATEAEISRCPQRTINTQQDELISDNISPLTNTKSSSSHRTACAICLEQFQIGDTVRTIPCFHTFHTSCIDPWLQKKAICPICKHSAIP